MGVTDGATSEEAFTVVTLTVGSTVAPPTSASYRSTDTFTTDPGTEDAISWNLTVTITMEPEGTLSGTVSGTGNGQPVSGTFSGSWGSGTFIASGSLATPGDTIYFGYSGSFTSLDDASISGIFEDDEGKPVYSFTASRI